MSVIDEVLEANRHYSLQHDPTKISPRPTRKLAILTCMDTRLRLATMGLAPQDAHIVRNAGGIVTDDALRSLLVSHYFLGTEEIMIINHTDCGLMKAGEEEIRRTIAGEIGREFEAPFRFYAFQDVEANVREQLVRLRSHKLFKKNTSIRGFVYDVTTGRLKEIYQEQT
jgi:carbonic anhydrase